jgi:peptidoglycan/xylan/chitin deacetylase (PgdA/CDA1 family)
MNFDLVKAGKPADQFLGLFAGKMPNARGFTRFALKGIKFCGLFRIARYLTRDGLRIICYHGFAIAEEYEYRGTLFIRGELFRRRIEYLKRKGYPILPLGAAVEELRTGGLSPCATVITMDDGWCGVYTVGLPIINELQIPVTLYVTTYYVENQIPVFMVALAYLFWRTTAGRVHLPRKLGSFDLYRQAEQAKGLALQFGESLPPAERYKFLKDVPFADIENQQLFRVIDERQLRCLAEAGIDIQLHSHHHDWPLNDRATVEAEIAKNRQILEQIVPNSLEHFCYPSGVYGPHQAEWLSALGVKSATTIDPGLNFADTSPFALRRLVDGHPVSDIEFEAEMTGFMEIVRALREKRLLSMLRRRFHPRWYQSRQQKGKG